MTITKNISKHNAKLRSNLDKQILKLNKIKYQIDNKIALLNAQKCFLNKTLLKLKDMLNNILLFI
jgi:hypothetical protein